MDVIEALRADRAVLLPADGVYGLCALAASETAVRNLYELKGRGTAQPTAIIAAGVEVLLEAIPELPRPLLDRLLPGAYTLVLPNPERRFPWLTGERPETIGVRVAHVPPATQGVLDAVGLIAATSANEPGEPPAATLDEVPRRIRDGCGAELDAGTLGGEPSTVVDYTGSEPVILRSGAGDVGMIRIEPLLQDYDRPGHRARSEYGDRAGDVRAPEDGGTRRGRPRDRGDSRT